jgi:hypothetical protein
MAPPNQGSYLEQRFGWHANYIPKQVRSGASDLRLAFTLVNVFVPIAETPNPFQAHDVNRQKNGEGRLFDLPLDKISERGTSLEFDSLAFGRVSGSWVRCGR